MPLKLKLPEFLKSGEWARLIPVVADSNKEVRATSIVLSTLSAVHEFSQNMFAAVGKRIGSRTNIEVYTEIVFKDKDKSIKSRPDGLIVINTGRTRWTALVEAKIGNNDLSPEQVKEYLALAKKHNINAVITISNQYSAIPTHHPIVLKKSDLKGVEIYHWSWRLILTEAVLLLKSQRGVEDTDQQFLLNEMVRYFSHESVGVSRFKQMNKEWKDVVLKAKNGTKLFKSSPEIEATVASWHQASCDLCLAMSQSVAVPVTLRLSQKHKKDCAARLRNDCELLASDHILKCELEIPDAVSPLKVTVNLSSRTVNCTMSLTAPKDKKRATARLNWLLRQLKNANPEDLYIKAYTLGKGRSPQESLGEIRENTDVLLLNEGMDIQPVAFDVVMVRDLAGKFSGRKTFIQEVKTVVKRFYDEAGEHLQQWVPSAPKVKKSKVNDVVDNDDFILIEELETSLKVAAGE